MKKTWPKIFGGNYIEGDCYWNDVGWIPLKISWIRYKIKHNITLWKLRIAIYKIKLKNWLIQKLR